MDREIVLITGTSSGFGYLTSLDLAKAGYYVIATMRDITKKNLLMEEAKQLNVDKQIEVLRLDVTKQDEIDEVRSYVERTYGRLDILINNAGYCLGGVAEYANLDDWSLQLQTNVLSVISVTKAFIPLMRKRKKGKIINIGSISGRFGFPGLGAYTTSKFALSGFSESLRLELAPFNIKVSIVEPGSFKTNIWDKSLNNVDLDYDEDYKPLTDFVYNQAKESAKNADNPQKVVRIIKKICLSKKPRFRYPVGKGVKGMLLLKTIVPWYMIEKIVLKKLRKRK